MGGIMKKKKIIIASDSYKGSASTIEVENFIEKGISRVTNNLEIVKIPIADGGEGTVDALVLGCKGQYKYVDVMGPYQELVRAKFGIINHKSAVIEMAQASGLTLAKHGQLNPYEATSYGTGELINEALKFGAEEIFIGIGGSATNDGGVGMAQALGVSFHDKNGQEIGLGAKELAKIVNIDTTNINPKLKQVPIYILSDVTNTLCGPNGASHVYGPQKGANKEQVLHLDQLLQHYGKKIKEKLDIDILEAEGAGAAGGLGAGLLVFCEAKMCRGITKILEILNIHNHLRDADLVITGEGRMDSQSLNGKAPVGIAKLAKKYNLPVIAIVGSTEGDLTEIYQAGIDLVIDIINQPMTLDHAIKDVEWLITNAGETAMRAFLLSKF